MLMFGKLFAGLTTGAYNRLRGRWGFCRRVAAMSTMVAVTNLFCPMNSAKADNAIVVNTGQELVSAIATANAWGNSNQNFYICLNSNVPFALPAGGVFPAITRTTDGSHRNYIVRNSAGLNPSIGSLIAMPYENLSIVDVAVDVTVDNSAAQFNQAINMVNLVNGTVDCNIRLGNGPYETPSGDFSTITRITDATHYTYITRISPAVSPMISSKFAMSSPQSVRINNVELNVSVADSNQLERAIIMHNRTDGTKNVTITLSGSAAYYRPSPGFTTVARPNSGGICTIKAPAGGTRSITSLLKRSTSTLVIQGVAFNVDALNSSDLTDAIATMNAATDQDYTINLIGGTVYENADRFWQITRKDTGLKLIQTKQGSNGLAEIRARLWVLGSETQLAKNVQVERLRFRRINGYPNMDSQGSLVEFAYAISSTIHACEFFEDTNVSGPAPVPNPVVKGFVKFYQGGQCSVNACYFHDKHSYGHVVEITPSPYNPPNGNKHLIIDCLFENITAPGQGSCVSIGEEGTTCAMGWCDVWSCAFRNFVGSSRTYTNSSGQPQSEFEDELISSKTSNNTFAKNNFYNCSGMLTLRGGCQCNVIGNFFSGMTLGGVRIHDSSHLVYSNYFETVSGRGAIVLDSGDNTTNYKPAFGCDISFNTMYLCSGGDIDFGIDGSTSQIAHWNFVRNNTMRADGVSGGHIRVMFPITDAAALDGFRTNEISRNHFYSNGNVSQPLVPIIAPPHVSWFGGGSQDQMYLESPYTSTTLNVAVGPSINVGTWVAGTSPLNAVKSSSVTLVGDPADAAYDGSLVDLVNTNINWGISRATISNQTAGIDIGCIEW